MLDSPSDQNRQPKDSPNVGELHSKADSLSDKYDQCGEIQYIEQAIELDRQALKLCTPSHPLQAECLRFLSHHLYRRFDEFGGLEYINESIDIAREELSLYPLGHSERPSSLTNLAVCLATRHRTFGDVGDLSEAITLDREAMSLFSPGHPGRSIALNSLASRLFTRYSEYGAIEDLSESINLDREALSLRPPGHPLRSTSLNNLAIDLSARYKRHGAVEDLTEAINLNREALSLCPPGHPARAYILNSLASLFSRRHHLHDAEEDLSEAIDLYREALLLRPPGHPLRSASLVNLADELSTRYDRYGTEEDLTEAINLNREGVSLCQPGNPDRSISLNCLADLLSAQYRKHGVIEDLTKAIELNRESLSLRPPGHPHRSIPLKSLVGNFKVRHKKFRTKEDEEEIFRLYCDLARDMPAVSSDDLSAAKSWVKDAEELRHLTTLLAYQTALRLLTRHVAALPSLPRHLSLLKSLSSSLAVDAFSAYARAESLMNAVELLEQGRGIFWGQLTRLRSPLDDLVASGPTGKELANEYTRITRDIQEVSSSSDDNQYDTVWRLHTDLERTISNIRQIPGLSRFLLPPLFSDLLFAASDGPVIIVNASQYSCDALIVFVDKDPVRIPLTITKEGAEDLTSRLSVLTARAKLEDAARDFSILLRAVWDQIVSPIFDILKRECRHQSRVWWCPSSEFSRLPLHAANPYRRGEKSFSDLFISSYTPTLSALVRARRPTCSPSTKLKSFVAIGQANAAGTSRLHTVGAELADIGQRLSGHSTFVSIEGEDSCVSRVTEELGKNAWVHLACHGIPDPEQPFDSAFALHDGRLTIRDISRTNVQNAEFAYLSACHTMVGDKESPDEAIHLAGAMQFAGFRSVIGTMWAVDDGQAKKVTSAFYKNMLDECGGLDHTKAAYALWKTMRTVRGVTLDQRVLYVHIGV